MENIWNPGIDIILALQGLGDGPAALFHTLSFFGSEGFFLLLVPLLYWSVDARLGARVGVVLLVTTGANALLKMLFAGPRPYWYSPRVAAHAAEPTFGLPSGHAQISASVWGALAGAARRPWFWAIATALVALIGISRLYLGVHFPSDVLAGWVIGVAIVAGCFALERPLGAWVVRFTVSRQIAVAFVTSLALVVPAWLVAHAQSDWQLPAAWAQTALLNAPDGPPLNPLSLDTSVTVAGTWFGFMAGLAALARRGSFSADGTIGRRMARFALGLAVLLLIWFVLGQIFPRHDDLLSYTLRYARYTLIGGWVAIGAPLLFQRLGL